MKKFTILLAFLSAITALKAQTNVSGGIYSSQTWTTAGSPYIIISDVVLFPGYSITIEPGVVVKFNPNTYLEIRGRIYAIGTPNDSITFTSNLTTPYMGCYGGITGSDTSFYRYCSFYYADTAIYGMTGYDGELSHCTFKNNFNGLNFSYITADSCNFYYNGCGLYEAGNIFYCNLLHNGLAAFNVGNVKYSVFKHNGNGLGVPGPQAFIDHCIIDSNRGYGLMTQPTDTVTNCEIEYDSIGVQSQSSTIFFNIISNDSIGIIEESGDDIRCNSICNNKEYNFILSTSKDIHIYDNYWCLSDSVLIQHTIYDGHQDLSLGLVYFTPYDTFQCTQITSVQNLVQQNNYKVYPNPSIGVFTIRNYELGITNIAVYNVLGEKVYSNNYQLKTIDLSKQPSGIYLYRITNESGKLLDTGKLIINH